MTPHRKLDLANEILTSNFLSSSATSFEKFAAEVNKIIAVLPNDKVQVATFHPEHVDPSRRSPMPISVLEWVKR